ncbi:MAG: zinc ribbon domain-containing protein [bacterium]
MKYCSHCKHLNLGRPKYCQYCGHTFNVKICRKGHINLPNNLVCGECGSREMSEPALPSRRIKMIRLAFLFVVVSILLIFAELIISLALLVLILWLGLNVFINLLPSPFNKILSAIGNTIKAMLGGGKNNKSGEDK